jgi:hypothetical protein
VFLEGSLHQWFYLILLSLIIAVGGQLGDLMLSSIKRDIGIKDTGTAIPGHGGLLDRFDSLLLVAPAVFHHIGYFRGIGLDQTQRIFTMNSMGNLDLYHSIRSSLNLPAIWECHIVIAFSRFTGNRVWPKRVRDVPDGRSCVGVYDVTTV